MRGRGARQDMALGAVYFLAFASAYVWTLMPRYLEGLGWTGVMVGGLFMARKIADMVTMGMWGRAADHLGRARTLILAQFALGGAALTGLLFFETWWPVVLICVAAQAALGGAIPLLDAITLRHVGAERYGVVRSWGSAGFGAGALLAALLGALYDYATLASWAPRLLLGFLAGSLMVTALIPDPEARAEAPPLREALGLFRDPGLALFMALGVVHWAAQQPFNLFFVALCEERALGSWVPGVGVGIAVAAEVVILSQSARLLSWARPETWLLAALVAAAARWGLMGWVTTEAGMLALQALHGVTFATFLAASMSVLGARVPEESRATGQAFFYMVVFGLGSLAGSALSGWVKDMWDVATLYLVVGVLEALAVPGALWLARKPHSQSTM